MDLAQLKRAHVLVTGDAMLDRYWFGAAARISPEARTRPSALNHGEAAHSRQTAAARTM